MAIMRGDARSRPFRTRNCSHGTPAVIRTRSRRLVHRHRDRMWAVALRTLGDQEEAADALQDAFLSAYRAAGRFRGDAAVTTWLHRIVVNACLDRLRRRTIRPVVPMGDDATLDSVAPKNTDPTSAHELSLDVSQALQRIPFEQRAALVLVDMMGYAVDDAAQVLDVPPGTIKSRCARGRARLVTASWAPAEPGTRLGRRICGGRRWHNPRDCRTP